MIDFCVPGFSKCGTTTLCDLLNSHSDIFVPPGKEPGYYAENFDRGRAWYAQSFETRGSQKLAGDGSTTYSSQEFAEVTVTRILSDAPDCKFIFIARNPRTRLESSFREMHASGYKYGVVPDFDLGSALQQLPNMIADTLYWKLLNIFRERIPDDKIHITFLEELKRDPQSVYAKCLEFLGLPIEQIKNKERKLNAAATKVCDTRLLRWIRSNRVASRWWGKLSLHNQEQLMTKLPLRRPFTSDIHWNEYAIKVFEETVRPDAERFLAHCGKHPTFWNMEHRSGLPVARAA